MQRLAKDRRIGLKVADLRNIIKCGEASLGAAHIQINHFLKRVKSWSVRYPDAQKYRPANIL